MKLPELYYAGSHGLDIVAPATSSSDDASSGEKTFSARCTSPRRGPGGDGRRFRRASAAISDIPGATVDHNKFCVSVHYRNCENREDWTRVKGVVDAIVATDPDRLKQAEGRKVFEVKPRVAWDKGKALSYLLGQLGLEANPANEKPGSVLSLYFGTTTPTRTRSTSCDSSRRRRVRGDCVVGAETVVRRVFREEPERGVDVPE